MLSGKKVVVVMPAYNAEQTLRRTYEALPHECVDEVILVDDASTDNTSKAATDTGIGHVHIHERNLGYGGNQKSCYRHALALDADIVIMIHPDYQYQPKLATAMASMIAEDLFDCVLGSRILGTGALKGGMPLHKYIANRILTLVQNLIVGHKLSEYHTGYRAFSREILATLPLDQNSDDFIFDNQMLLQIIARGFRIGEVTCPTRYEPESSSIEGLKLMKYGLGVLIESLNYFVSVRGWVNSRYTPD
jgi:glycosyltransferase involved in cell wall biosynthesis